MIPRINDGLDRFGMQGPSAQEIVGFIAVTHLGPGVPAMPYDDIMLGGTNTHDIWIVIS